MGAIRLTYHNSNLRASSKLELTNHLNNVLSVISDKVIPHPSGGSVAYYKADILQAMDYSPFGVKLKGRNLNKTGNTELYRNGFQGQEEDDELKGDGNSVNYTFRMHDPRLGRFFKIDPLIAKYPSYSSYSFSGNKVIVFIELEGGEEKTTENCSQVLEGFPNAWINPAPKGFMIINSSNTLDETNDEGVVTYQALFEYKQRDAEILSKWTANCQLKNTNFGMISESCLKNAVTTLDAYQTQYNIEAMQLIVFIAHGSSTKGLHVISSSTDPKTNYVSQTVSWLDQKDFKGGTNSADANAFIDMVSTLDDGGALLMVVCNLGDIKDITTEILMNPKVKDISIYINRDKSCTRESVTDGKPVNCPGPENNQGGFLKLTKVTKSVLIKGLIVHLPVIKEEEVGTVTVDGQGGITTKKIE